MNIKTTGYKIRLSIKGPMKRTSHFCVLNIVALKGCMFVLEKLLSILLVNIYFRNLFLA